MRASIEWLEVGILSLGMGLISLRAISYLGWGENLLWIPAVLFPSFLLWGESFLFKKLYPSEKTLRCFLSSLLALTFTVFAWGTLSRVSASGSLLSPLGLFFIPAGGLVAVLIFPILFILAVALKGPRQKDSTQDKR